LVQKTHDKPVNQELTVCIVGVGYVGYPLACEFSKHVNVIGFDIDSSKVKQYNGIHDETKLTFTADETRIKEADVVMICVPTPVKKSKEPDLTPVKSASKVVGKYLKQGSIVVLESTYYPGVTEEICVPIIEKHSGLECGVDFWVGYSPERVNPGDTEHTLSTITKIVSGMDQPTTIYLTELYGLITEVYPVSDIKTAEAAKVIENIQRDLNIALVNELALIMHKLDIDIDEVLDAAATKWNFVRYSPGLVGGHCIPVDPYYLVYRAKEMGYHPQVILAGRAINDNMPKVVVEMTVKALIEAEKLVKNAKVLVMGLTYKENVPDFRESPSLEIIHELKEYHMDVYACDPYASSELIQEYGAKPYQKGTELDCIILAVKHKEYTSLTHERLKQIMPHSPVLIDVKGIYKNKKQIINSIHYKKL
jgi:UDP-N-acetyl-D-glucosamine/UDP-N-acetyl-D-galactosamine dehydrogenase